MSQRVESKQQERTIFALTHIGVGPRLERTDLGGAVIRIRKEDARNLAQYGVGLDAADERQTVNSGHLCVNQDRGWISTVSCNPSAPLSASASLNPFDSTSCLSHWRKVSLGSITSRLGG